MCYLALLLISFFVVIIIIIIIIFFAFFFIIKVLLTGNQIIEVLLQKQRMYLINIPVIKLSHIKYKNYVLSFKKKASLASYFVVFILLLLNNNYVNKIYEMKETSLCLFLYTYMYMHLFFVLRNKN